MLQKRRFLAPDEVCEIYFFKCLMFGKWAGLKNNPNNIYFLVRAVQITGVLSLLVILTTRFVFWTWDDCPNSVWLDLFNKAPLALVTSFVVIYWRLREDFHKKWEEANRAFREIYLNAPNPRVKEYLIYGLAVDLITADLWGHPSWSEWFCNLLETAIKHDHPNSTDLFVDLTESKARDILLNYQTYFSSDEINPLG